jgi:hypothetical protein
MDIDVVQGQGQGQGQRMSDQEQQYLIQEGHCCFCKEQGHLSNVCLKKQAHTNMLTCAYIMEVIKTINNTGKAMTGVPNVLELTGYLQGLSDNDKAKVLEEILKSDSSF